MAEQSKAEQEVKGVRQQTALTGRESARSVPKTGPNSLKEKSIPVERQRGRMFIIMRIHEKFSSPGEVKNPFEQQRAKTMVRKEKLYGIQSDSFEWKERGQNGMGWDLSHRALLYEVKLLTTKRLWSASES